MLAFVCGFDAGIKNMIEFVCCKYFCQICQLIFLKIIEFISPKRKELYFNRLA